MLKAFQSQGRLGDMYHRFVLLELTNQKLSYKSSDQSDRSIMHLTNQKPCQLTNQSVVVMTGLTPCTRMVGGRSLVTVSNMERKAECWLWSEGGRGR